MSLLIRPFTADDYAAVVAVDNSVYTEYTGTVEEWQRRDEHRDPKLFFQRLVAEQDGRVVGFGMVSHIADMYHPRKFWMEIVVYPEQQGQGIGLALYERLLDVLAPFDPLVVRTSAREDWTRSLRFLDRHGFAEEMRVWESRLHVASFDPTPYADAEERVRSQGIVIKTLRELESDPNRNRKLYELELELVRDVPAPDQVTDIDYEYFLKNRLDNPNLLPDAFFVALDGDEYVGISALWASQSSTDLYTGLTGVKRSHRRRGIALAMKLRGIAYARSINCPTIKTWNESNNRPMLSINEMFGYVKQPAWINFAKALKEEDYEYADQAIYAG